MTFLPSPPSVVIAFLVVNIKENRQPLDPIANRSCIIAGVEAERGHKPSPKVLIDTKLDVESSRVATEDAPSAMPASRRKRGKERQGNQYQPSDVI